MLADWEVDMKVSLREGRDTTAFIKDSKFIMGQHPTTIIHTEGIEQRDAFFWTSMKASFLSSHVNYMTTELGKGNECVFNKKSSPLCQCDRCSVSLSSSCLVTLGHYSFF